LFNADILYLNFAYNFSQKSFVGMGCLSTRESHLLHKCRENDTI